MARPGNFFGNFKDFALAFSGISYCLITEVREAVLIAQRHPDTVKALLAELNRQKDKKGRPYHFALTTWDEEGIALPPDAA